MNEEIGITEVDRACWNGGIAAAIEVVERVAAGLRVSDARPSNVRSGAAARRTLEVVADELGRLKIDPAPPTPEEIAARKQHVREQILSTAIAACRPITEEEFSR